MKNNISRVLIGGSGSGCGKTTVTLGLLSALKLKKMNITAFKCGPDYIDPMFHSEILETKSRNLDLYLCDENTVKYLMAEDSGGSDMAVIEGVMGIYDGAGFEDDSYSANHIARVTGTPEILVLNVRGKGLSLAAEALGYLSFSENKIKGFILNNCSKAMYSIYEKLLFEKTGLKCYGYMPHIAEGEIGSRHLGLITAEEIDDLKDRMEILGRAASESLDVEGIEALAASTESFEYEEINIEKGEEISIAIARDKAFSFYYEDNLRLLELLGAKLIQFSPMNDKKLPDGICGIILGGGYPEVHIEKLTENKSMLNSIKAAVASGMPTYAECGGFMYLGESITTENGCYETVGAIPGNSHITAGLVRFGYKNLTANKDNVMCSAGESIKCHEFHYSDTDEYGEGFIAENRRGRTWETGVATKSMYAGYPHLHLWSNINFAAGFVKACRSYGGRLWK